MLGPSLQGEWSLYINAYAFGTMALGLGLPPAINHFLAAGKIEKKNLVGQLFLFSIIVGFLFWVGANIIFQTNARAVVFPTSVSEQLVLFGLSVHFFLLLFNQLLGSILLAEKMFRRLAEITIVGAVGLLLGYSYFFYFSKQLGVDYLEAFIFLNILILLVQGIFYCFQIKKAGGFSFKLSLISLPLFTLLMGFAAWAYVTNLLQFLNYRMDIWFISYYEKNDRLLGIYGVAVSLSQLIWLLPNAFHSIIFSDISGQANLDYRKKINKWVPLIFIYAVSTAVVGYFLSFWLVPILFKSSYSAVIEVFPYLLPGIVVFAPTILLSAYFAGLNKVSVNFTSSLLGFLLNIGLNFILIPMYSIIGAAVASSFSYVLSALYLYHKYRRLQ